MSRIGRVRRRGRALPGAVVAGVCLLLWAGPAARPVGAAGGTALQPSGDQSSGDQPSGGAEASGPTLEAEGGIGGWTVPGREYPVRVTIATDRLLAGVVRVHAPDAGTETTIEREVEVSGGSTARVDLVMPAWPVGFGDEGRVALVVDGEVVARTTFAVRNDPAQELVGLLPASVRAAGGADALPGTVPLAVDLGVARPVALDPDLLALGALALGPLDQLVATPAELADLPTGHRAAVTGWVQAGGQLLLVGDDLDTAGAVLPDGWQPGPGTGARAGLGQVRAAGDDWTRGLLPSPTQTSDEEGLVASDLFAPPLPVSSELGEAAGLRLPGGRALGIMLAAYVVLAGPVVFLVVRRLRRGQLAWVAIPLLAVGSTGVVFTTGSALRRSLSSAQVTVYETGPAGTVATTWSLLANKDGGEVGVTLPEGWVAGDRAADGGDFAAAGAIPRGPIVADGPQLDASVRVASGPGGADAEALVSSPVAGYGTVKARGPVTGMDGALEVTARSDAEGVVRGTVRNRLDVALDEVAVLAGRAGIVDVGTLGAGEERAFTIEGATTFVWGQTVEPTVWPQPEPGGFRVFPADPGAPVIIEDGSGTAVEIAPTIAVPPPVAEAREDAAAAAPPAQPVPPIVPPDVDDVIVAEGEGGGRSGGDGVSPVVSGAWAATQGRVGWNYRPIGQVVAVGWTDELAAPVAPSSGAGPARSSRSAVVARATVAPAGERLTDAAVVRSLVRGPGTESPGGDEVGGVYAFYLPATVGGRPVDTRNLVMNPGAIFSRAELWTPGGWLRVDVPVTGQAEIAVPPEAVVDGVVVYRWAAPAAVPESGGRDVTIYEKEAPR